MTNEIFLWMLGVMMGSSLLILTPALFINHKYSRSKGFLSLIMIVAIFAPMIGTFWLFLPTKTEKVTQFNVSKHIHNHSARCTSYLINNEETNCADEAFVYLNATNPDSLKLEHQIEYNRFGQILKNRYMLTDRRTGKLLEMTGADKTID